MLDGRPIVAPFRSSNRIEQHIHSEFLVNGILFYFLHLQENVSAAVVDDYLL